MGGAGRDILTGGAGSDTFEFELGFGRDVITDFQLDTSGTGAHDLLDLRGLGFMSVEDALFHTTGGASAVIHAGGDAITLIGVSKLQLQSHLDSILV